MWVKDKKITQYLLQFHTYIYIYIYITKTNPCIRTAITITFTSTFVFTFTKHLVQSRLKIIQTHLIWANGLGTKNVISYLSNNIIWFNSINNLIRFNYNKKIQLDPKFLIRPKIWFNSKISIQRKFRFDTTYLIWHKNNFFPFY